MNQGGGKEMHVAWATLNVSFLTKPASVIELVAHSITLGATETLHP